MALGQTIKNNEKKITAGNRPATSARREAGSVVIETSQIGAAALEFNEIEKKTQQHTTCYIITQLLGALLSINIQFDKREKILKTT